MSLSRRCLELLDRKRAERGDVVFVREDVHVDVQRELVWVYWDRSLVARDPGRRISSIVFSEQGDFSIGAFVIESALLVRFERLIVAAVEKVEEARHAGLGIDGEVDDAFLGFLPSHVRIKGCLDGFGDQKRRQTFIPLVHIALSGFDWQQMTFLCTANRLSPQMIVRSENSPVFSNLLDGLAICVTRKICIRDLLGQACRKTTIMFAHGCRGLFLFAMERSHCNRKW